MPRKPLIRSPHFPYHIYNRALDKQFYPLNMDDLWNESNDLLRTLTWTYGFEIHAFVLMSNHYHLIATTPGENLDEGIRYFQSFLSTWISEKTNSKRFRFEGRYKASLITKSSYYLRVYQYVYQNPIRAGIADLAENYLYSSIAGRAGIQFNFCPISHSKLFEGLIPEDFNHEIEFLNDVIDSDSSLKTKRGLRKKIFTPPKRIHKTR